VVRNRIKRRLREQVRLELLPVLEAQWWIVFNPRRAVLDATVMELRVSVHKLRDRLVRSSAPPSSAPSAATNS
jgi:ribonuclease P protein component